MKKLTSLLIASSLVAQMALAADFSKKSDAEILNLAKSVNVSDQAKLELEMRKRMNEMKYQEARDFRQEFRDNLRENISKLSYEDRKKRHYQVRKDLDKLTENMSVKEFKNLNLHHKSHMNERNGYECGKGHRYGHGYMEGNHHRY